VIPLRAGSDGAAIGRMHIVDDDGRFDEPTEVRVAGMELEPDAQSIASRLRPSFRSRDDGHAW
jgi:hypothetical protein